MDGKTHFVELLLLQACVYSSPTIVYSCEEMNTSKLSGFSTATFSS